MSHPVQDKMQAVGRRATRLLAVFGLATWLAFGIAAIALLALADALLRYQDPGLRMINSLAAVVVIAWAGYRYLWPALTLRLSPVQVALRVERRFPHLADSLASSVQFLDSAEDNLQAGSPQLRRAVIAQTTAAISEIRPADVVAARPALRALACLAGVLLAAVGLALVHPPATQLALARLAMPWAELDWPKVNHLALKEEVRRVALGQRFEVEVVDAAGAELPDEVWIHYRFAADGGGYTEATEAMQLVRGAMQAGRDNVSRPFAYRVTGGDDDSMDWVDLEVVEPPAIVDLKATLLYPEYTGWGTAAGEPHLRAIAGTRVELAGRSTKPLREARLHLEPGDPLPLEISQDGYGVKLAPDTSEPLVISRSGSYWFELVDVEGFAGGQNVRYEIRAIEDRAPTVTLEEPRSDLSVTAEAVVPLALLVKDDLAIRDVSLHFSRSDRSSEPETVIPLFTGPEQVAVDPRDVANLDRGESRVVQHALELASLQLKPGTQLTLYATANDYRPQVGQSPPRRLYIITADELQDRLAEKQAFILGELARVLKLEQESRSQVAGLLIQLDEVGRFTKQDLDHLQGAELTQRQVDRGLTSPAEGVKGHIRGLLDDLQNNRVEADDVRRRMESFLAQIDQLEADHLPAISQELTSAVKSTQAAMQQNQGQQPAAGSARPQPDSAAPQSGKPTSEPQSGKPADAAQPADAGQAAEPGQAADRVQQPAPPQADAPPPARETVDHARESLTAAAEHQDQVIGRLEQMLGDLSQWDSYRRFYRDLGAMRREQDALRNETSELGRETLTRDVKDLSQQQQADLRKLAQRQTELSRRFDKTLNEMRQSLDSLAQSDPLAADALSDALHQAERNDVAGKMQEASRGIERNQVGQAAQRQTAAAEQLQELLDILSNRREFELNRLVQKLREAERQLADLREQQRGLRKKFEEAEKIEDPQQRQRELQRLSRQQRELQEQTERFSRALRRLQADNASRTASRSGSRMGQAGEAGQQGEGGQAADQAAAAERDLDDAQQQLAQQRRQAEVDLAMEQLARMEDALKGMAGRQALLIEETAGYEAVRQEQGRLSRAQIIGLRDLARQQAGLQDETDALARKVAAAAAFELALDSAARFMEQAADGLDRQETGSPTRRAQENALARFEQLLKSLEPDENDQHGEQGEQGQQGEGQQGQQQGEIRQLAELKLLKLLQQDINRRTVELEESFRDGQPIPPEAQQEYLQLGEEQGRLADLLLDLAQPSASKVDELEKIPDLEFDLPEGKPPADDDLLQRLLEPMP